MQITASERSESNYVEVIDAEEQVANDTDANAVDQSASLDNLVALIDELKTKNRSLKRQLRRVSWYSQ